MDITYCYEECEKGQEFARKAIHECESAFDAAFDFRMFTKECFNTCPYKEFHKEEKSND